MSRDNVELVRNGYRAFESGDRDAVMELLAPDVVWYPALGALLETSSYHGREAVCRLIFEEIPAVLEGFVSEVIEVRDLGADAVLALVRFRGRAVSAGLDVVQTFVHVNRMRDGKLVELRSYSTIGEALEAVGGASS